VDFDKAGIQLRVNRIFLARNDFAGYGDGSLPVQGRSASVVVVEDRLRLFRNGP
jgi:hypothetical protein